MTRAGAAEAGSRTPQDDRALREALELSPDAGAEEIAAARVRLTALLEDLEQQSPATNGAGTAPAHEAPAAHDLDPHVPTHDPQLEADGDDEPPARATARASARTGSAAAERRRSRLTPFVALALIAAVVVGVYQIGGGAGEPEQGAASWNPPTADAAAPQLDTARVTELETQVVADPSDVVALTELADLHLAAGEYLDAARWQEEIVALDPEDTDARLVLGVALFNGGDLAGAEEQWTTVVAQDPGKAEAYYDLGFLHVSKQPSDLDAARAAWQKVIELEPDSELARIVATHIDGLGAMSDEADGS